VPVWHVLLLENNDIRDAPVRECESSSGPDDTRSHDDNLGTVHHIA
jgi:hypothetical protein